MYCNVKEVNRKIKPKDRKSKSITRTYLGCNKKISLRRLEKVQKTLFDNQTEKNKSLENKIINEKY